MPDVHCFIGSKSHGSEVFLLCLKLTSYCCLNWRLEKGREMALATPFFNGLAENDKK